MQRTGIWPATSAAWPKRWPNKAGWLPALQEAAAKRRAATTARRAQKRWKAQCSAPREPRRWRIGGSSAGATPLYCMCGAILASVWSACAHNRVRFVLCADGSRHTESCASCVSGHCRSAHPVPKATMATMVTSAPMILLKPLLLLLLLPAMMAVLWGKVKPTTEPPDQAAHPTRTDRSGAHSSPR